MIDVRMGENEEIDRQRIETEMAVDVFVIAAGVLEKSTVQKDAFVAAGGDQMLAAGYRLCGTVKGDLHGGKVKSDG